LIVDVELMFVFCERKSFVLIYQA